MRFDKYIGGTGKVTKGRNWSKFFRRNKESLAEGRGCSRHSESVQGWWSGWNSVIRSPHWSAGALDVEASRRLLSKKHILVALSALGTAFEDLWDLYTVQYRIARMCYNGCFYCHSFERFIKDIASYQQVQQSQSLFTCVFFCITRSFNQNYIKGIYFIISCIPCESHSGPSAMLYCLSYRNN